MPDIGLPGPDRGEGGRYLLVPPGYKVELPEAGYFVNKVRTTRVTMFGRSFLEEQRPQARGRGGAGGVARCRPLSCRP